MRRNNVANPPNRNPEGGVISYGPPSREDLNTISTATKRLYGELEKIRQERYPYGPHELPPSVYERVYAIIAELRTRFHLPFIVQENKITRIDMLSRPAELLRSPEMCMARSLAQHFGFLQSDSGEESPEAALRKLAENGIYFAALISDDEGATIYYSSGGDHVHNTLRAELIRCGQYSESFPATSGMLVHNAGRFVFVTDESQMIWPQHLRQTTIGYMPALCADLSDISMQQDRPSDTALLCTSEGHALFAADDQSMRELQQDRYDAWVKNSYYR